jgi:hypothetical protein
MKGGIYFTATQCAPTFVQEIVDLRAVELETVTFECQFSGTPTPGKFYFPLNLCEIIITVSEHHYRCQKSFTLTVVFSIDSCPSHLTVNVQRRLGGKSHRLIFFVWILCSLITLYQLYWF